MARGVRRFFGDPEPIQKNYLVDDLRADAAGFDLVGSVHVQVGVAPGDELSESEWLQFTADSEGLPSAIVAYCELERPDIATQLENHATFSRVRGVRQIVGRSVEEDARTGSGGLLEDEHWLRGLRVLAASGLSFDLQLIPQQMQHCAELLCEVPKLDVALCHCGSPWDQTDSGLRKWRAGLASLAALENVHCKISGLGMFDHDWTTASIRPIVEAVIEEFGFQRCMFGSNFPVDKLHASYDRVWGAYAELATQFTDAQRASMFRENAAAFYRI